tara:strand:- start:475 stop:654 length:180 start_codon:yes stop_codon:yes gene_type:complete
MDTKKFTITKQIAKHGKQAVIVIPKILEESLKPKTIVKLNIEILKEVNENLEELEGETQ